MLLLTDCISHTKFACIKNTDDITRVCFFDGLSFRGKELLRLGQAEHLAALAVKDACALFENAGADAHECDSVVMLGIHIRLDFENESGEGWIFREIEPSSVFLGSGGGASCRYFSRNGCTPKFVMAEPKNIGVSSPFFTFLHQKDRRLHQEVPDHFREIQ